MGRFEVFFSGPVKEAAGASGTPEYWENLEARHRDHRAMARNLGIVAALLIVLGVAVNTQIFAGLLIVVPLLVLQVVLALRSRPS